MALYIMDKPYCENGIPYALADEDAKILLLHDALFLNLEALSHKRVFALDKEIEKRGLQATLPESVMPISYEEAVELIVNNTIINFA